MDLITVYDCTGSNLSKITIPAGVKMAGYITGSDGVPWTAEQLATHPDAIRIDQSPQNTPADETADVLDVEQRAATLADIPGWWHAASANYQRGVRPGQREPLIYCNQSMLTPVANALKQAGIMGGVGLWLAAEMSTADAAAKVLAGSGPWPVRGVQCAFLGDHDLSVFSATWFNTRSKKPVTSVPGPGTQTGWRYCWKCKSLFYGPEQEDSFCGLNGRHDGSRSHEYTLGFIK